jgi:hypothetical protein
LVVDANAVLPLASALERFEPVARKAAQRSRIRSRFQPVEALFRLPAERLEGRDMLAFGKHAGSLVPIAQDHAALQPKKTHYIKRKPVIHPSRRGNAVRFTPTA